MRVVLQRHSDRGVDFWKQMGNGSLFEVLFRRWILLTVTKLLVIPFYYCNAILDGLCSGIRVVVLLCCRMQV